MVMIVIKFDVIMNVIIICLILMSITHFEPSYGIPLILENQSFEQPQSIALSS